MLISEHGLPLLFVAGGVETMGPTGMDWIEMVNQIYLQSR
jgi:hypothetical protein